MSNLLTIPDHILGLIHSRGHWESLEDDEAEVLYTAAMSIPHGSQIVEIGCEVGRSSVLLASVAKERDNELVFIDPWIAGQPFFAAEWMTAIHAIGHPFTLHHRRSDAVQFLPRLIGLLYIDGDHTEQGICYDCVRYMPWVMTGCYVAFHDYGRWSLPSVKDAVDHYTNGPWELAFAARTMRIWKRL